MDKISGLNSQQSSGVKEDFKSFAARMNATFPDRTSTVAEKKQAISAKKQIMNHPQCPPEIKAELQKEIKIIEQEIRRMQNVFDK